MSRFLTSIIEQGIPEKPKLEIVPTVQDSVSKSNEVRVSKGKGEQISVSKGKQVETAAKNDFTKVQNSITKTAIPEKYFRGLSKHTYDILHKKTRGAIVPTRTVQLTKDELVRLTGLSKDAVKLHIKYLKDSGLLESRQTIGNHSGWEYEVFVPEELDGVSKGKGVQVSVSKGNENLPLHTGQNLLTLTPTNNLENKEVSESVILSLKQRENIDDEPFGAMNEFFMKMCEKATGKKSQKSDAGKWLEFAELVGMEFDIAFARAESVSNVPAFLTEHLRRKLTVEKSKGKPAKVDTVGRDGGKINREIELVNLRDILADSGMEEVEKWKNIYTPEDWQWLTEELEKGK